MRISIVLVTMLLGVAACSAQAVTLPGPVVSAEWLHQNLDGVTVLDVRDSLKDFTSAPKFGKDEKTGAQVLLAVGGHIPGALAVDFGKVRVKRKVEGHDIVGLLPDKAQFEALMQSLGLNAGKPIVITAPGSDLNEIEAAARLYWSLKYYGEDALALLDGGNAAWLQAGFPVSSDPAPTGKGDWTARAERRELLAETADVLAAAKSGKQLVDARPANQYFGVFYKKPAVKAGGHVAGAKDMPPDLRSRASGKAQVFLSADEYRKIYKGLGIDPDAPSVTYCNTGHLASGAWFIQSEILGNKDVSLYDGSMTEWTTLGHPVEGVGN